MLDSATTLRTSVVPRFLQRRVVELRNCSLVVESGPHAGAQFGPLGEQTTIGREDWCDIGLNDPHVSKLHCELMWTPEGLRLRDLASTNGVYCDAMRVYDVLLGSGARFRVGSNVFRVMFGEGSLTSAKRALDPSGSLVGASPAMQRLFAMMGRVASREIPVLLLGETGTGKTALARAMHQLSARESKPFVSVNCAALPAELIESTLFGHVRGAFTGAHRTSAGIFEQASGGSVLLDEIGDMPLHLQAKLLSVLESSRVRPVGGEQELPVDFRLFCATNRSIATDVAEGRFRQDLYYRIAGMELTIPPLRERIGDVSVLAECFALRCAERMRENGEQCRVAALSGEAIRALERHSWPGNVRELENVISRAVTLSETETIDVGDILLTTWQAGYEALPSFPTPALVPGYSERPPDGSSVRPPSGDAFSATQVGSFKAFKAALLQAHERVYFQQLMSQTGGNVTRAAQISGISRSYVTLMLKKYGL